MENIIRNQDFITLMNACNSYICDEVIPHETHTPIFNILDE